MSATQVDTTRRWIAFLRAINVGGHTVKMNRLRALFEELDFANVETFIASGNVIFEASAGGPKQLEDRIERHLREALGYDVASFLRSPAELAAAADHQPFPAAAEQHLQYIAFLKEAPAAAAQEQLLGLRSDVDDFHFRGRELYWCCRTSSHVSKFSGAVLEKALRMPATLRNVTTVRKLAAKYRSYHF